MDRLSIMKEIDKNISELEELSQNGNSKNKVEVEAKQRAILMKFSENMTAFNRLASAPITEDESKFFDESNFMSRTNSVMQKLSEIYGSK